MYLFNNKDIFNYFNKNISVSLDKNIRFVSYKIFFILKINFYYK